MDPKEEEKKKVSFMDLSDSELVLLLERVPLDFLCRARCVCRRVRDLIADWDHLASGRRLYGLFADTSDDRKFLPADPHHPAAALSLPFLGRRIVPVAASNRLLFCVRVAEAKAGCGHRRRIEECYVCDPAAGEFVVVPKGRRFPEAVEDLQVVLGTRRGLHDFVVVSAHEIKTRAGRAGRKVVYGFEVYSSVPERKRSPSWKMVEDLSHAVYLTRGIYQPCTAYLDGVAHWLSTNHRVLAFRLSDRKSWSMHLPKPSSEASKYDCWFGECGGALWYIESSSLNQLKIYKTVDNRTGDRGAGHDEWVLEHDIVLEPLTCLVDSMACKKRKGRCLPLALVSPYKFNPLGFDGRSVLIQTELGRIASYNLITGQAELISDCKTKDIDLAFSKWYIPFYINIVY